MPDQKPSIGKLTKQNLEQQFNTPHFERAKVDETDIETESIMLFDQSLMSPRNTNGTEKLEQLKQQMSGTKEEKASSRVIGEQIINNTSTIKSKSITQSQMGGQESENMRRLQEALQSKKEVNNELNQKLLSLQQEQALQSKKHQLIQDDNNALREELRRLKKESRAQADQIQEL